MVPDRLQWMIGRRLRWQRSVEGFSAAINTYADKECDFKPYSSLHAKTWLSHVSVGMSSYIAGARVSHAMVGNFCSIGPEVLIGLGMHPTEWISTHPAFYSDGLETKLSLCRTKYTQHKTTTVGHDVWIGARAILLDGVSIGNGAIIAAGAVVTTDVEPYAVVAGVPARTIKFRFDEAVRHDLLALQWWNLPLDKIKNVAKYFVDSTVRPEEVISIVRRELKIPSMDSL